MEEGKFAMGVPCRTVLEDIVSETISNIGRNHSIHGEKGANSCEGIIDVRFRETVMILLNFFLNQKNVYRFLLFWKQHIHLGIVMLLQW